MRTLFLTAGLLVTAFSLDAATPQSLYEEAAAAYMKSDYRKVVVSYEQIISEHGVSSVEVYYNLGNAYFKLTDYPNAIINYERALKIRPDDEDVQANLRLANQKIQDKIEPVPDLFYKRWTLALRNLLPVTTWAVVFLVVFTLSAASFFLFVLGQSISLRKTGFYSGIVFLVLAGVTFSMAWSLNNYRYATNQAIIFSGSVSVKSSPAESGTSLFVLHAGTKVTITDRLGEWVKVRIADGNEGWMPQADMEVI